MYDVIVIGSGTRDIFLDVKNIKPIESNQFTTGQALCFGFGSKIAIDKMVATTGGGGSNVSVGLARQGFNVAYVGVIGDDLNGQEILRELNSEGVNSGFVKTHNDDQTAYSVILVSENGERTILSYKGEGQHLSVKNLPFDEFKTNWLSLNSLGGNFELLETVINWAQTQNIKVAINPGTKELELGPDKLKLLLKKCSIVTMNQEEASMLTGLDFKDEKDLFKATDEIVDGVFIMTKGPGGVSASDGKNIYSAGTPDSPVIERTGAGDAFFSGFLSEYLRSGDIAKSIQLGTANATSVVEFYGSKQGLLRVGDMGRYPLVEVKVTQI